MQRKNSAKSGIKSTLQQFHNKTRVTNKEKCGKIGVLNDLEIFQYPIPSCAPTQGGIFVLNDRLWYIESG